MKKFTHRYINQVTGSFVLLALLILLSIIFVAGQEHKWFERTVAFGLLLPEEGSYGLKSGATVMVLGTVAGEITDIRITPGDRMLARMIVRQDFARFIGTDSLATIKKTMGLAGDAFVNISGRPGKPLENDALINAVVDRAVMEMAQETLEQIRAELLPAIRSIRLAAESHVQLVSTLENPALKTLEALNSIVTKVDKGPGLVNRILADKKMADDISSVINRADIMFKETSLAAKEIQAGAAQVGKSTLKLHDSIVLLPETIHKANATLEDIHKVSKNLIHITTLMSSTVENVNSQVTSLSGVMVQAQATLREIQRLTEATQQHWLIRDYVEEDSSSARIAPEEVIVTP